jgi:glycosyltransferase involved in cell wall biosynthesis
MPPQYSVCITHHNNAETVERSLRSILDQIDDRFEVVVVDQSSTDGSLEVLERFERENAIRLFHQKIQNRGLGRQLAFEMSKGDYVISQIDMDDIYEPVIRQLVSTYERSMLGMVFRAVNEQKRGAVTVAPRAFLEDIHGWPDLDYLEDRWIWGCAAERGIYCWARFPLYSKITESREKRSFLSRMARVYGIQRDRIRIGAEAHVSKSTWPLFLFSYLAAKTSPRIARPIFGEFWPDDPKFCADDLTRSSLAAPSGTPA